MKTSKISIHAVFSLLLPFCALMAAAQQGPQDISVQMAELKSLGFYVFDKPVAVAPFQVPGLSGSSLKLDSLKGKITLLNFWATWCPPCRKEMPSIEKLQTLMKGTAFSVVAISVGEDVKTVREFIDKNKYTFPIYLDERGEVGQAYASQGIPTTYIVDKQGLIIAGVVGSFEYDNPALIKTLKALADK
jgi:thiol-disulfide isomerase/thioredoxin